VAPSRRNQAAAAGAGAVLCAALAFGCRSEHGTLYVCECIFVTDFDDDAKTAVEVCAPSEERVEAIARGCAQAGAPGPVQGCACRRNQTHETHETHEACSIGACRASAGAP
jgi:hypothetical protein